jgi:hypothetical protein
MLKRFVGSVVKSLGYEIIRRDAIVSQSGPYGLGYDLEDEAYQNILKVHRHTMVSYERLVTLYQQVVFCETHEIPGCLVECGTWKGGAAALMALANLNHGSTRRKIHLFDSFVGAPEPDELVDGETAVREARKVGAGTTGKLVPVHEADDWGGSLEVNKELLEQTIGYDPNYLHYHKGWFQVTLPNEADEVGEIAILRLDGDWYASTRVCLEHLYDKVVRGGFIIVDDYGCYEGCKKAVDEFMKTKSIQAYLNFIDDTGRYWIKP